MRVSAKRVARVMQAAGGRAKPRRRFRVTTDARHGEPVASNVLARRFGVAWVGAADRVWAGAITYVATREGWLYLSVGLDIASRRVIGWACSAEIRLGQ